MPDAVEDGKVLEIRVDPVAEEIYVIIPRDDQERTDVLVIDFDSAHAMLEGLSHAVLMIEEYGSLPGAREGS